MPALEVEQRAEGVRIRVRVKLRASKCRILGVRDAVLEVALAAPPMDGAANAEAGPNVGGRAWLRKKRDRNCLRGGLSQ